LNEENFSCGPASEAVNKKVRFFHNLLCNNDSLILKDKVMNRPKKTPKKSGIQSRPNDYDKPTDTTPSREGGDDAIADSSPSDSRLDEKVVVNTQREHKAVNAPSQTAAHPSELEGSDEDVI
jgi:hypothetical protein